MTPSGETHVDRARERVRTERDAVAETVSAYDRFLQRVESLSAEPTASRSPGGVTAAGGTVLGSDGSADEGTRRALAAFAETVRPHVGEDGAQESVLAAVRSELSESIAVALAPTTDAVLTPERKGALLEAARERRSEQRATERALEREAEQLEAVATTVDDVREWIVATDERPLSACGFERLRERHETLATHRDRCRSALADRQAFLRETTSVRGAAGIGHRTLVEHCYRDFPVDYPALDVLVRLEAVCRTCQRAVRDHLVRRA